MAGPLLEPALAALLFFLSPVPPGQPPGSRVPMPMAGPLFEPAPAPALAALLLFLPPVPPVQMVARQGA